MQPFLVSRKDDRTANWFLGFERRDRRDDLICGYDGAGVVW